MGAVDVYQYKTLGDQYRVREFPTIMIFGDDKKAPKEYTGVWTCVNVRVYMCVWRGGEEWDEGSGPEDLLRYIMPIVF